MRRMLITGGSRGIGPATAELAATRGWSVGLIYSSPESQEAAAVVVERCRAAGAPDVVALRADVSVEADVLGAFETIDARWGGLDCLVNNAGIAPGYGPFEQLAVADMERTWAVNLTGAFVCAREAVKLMIRDGGGSIVNIGSKAGVIGGPDEWIHYAASKGAIDTLTSGLAKEFADRGVRVNCVRVGLVAGGFGPWAPDGRVERMEAAIPMRRAGNRPRSPPRSCGWRRPKRPTSPARSSMSQAAAEALELEGSMTSIEHEFRVTRESYTFGRMVNVTVTVDENTLRRARIHALEQGTSVNALVRLYLERLVSSDRSREVGVRLVARSRRVSANSGAGGRNWHRDELYDE